MSSLYYALFVRRKLLTKDQIKAIKSLRYRGYSLPEISRELSVPKTTAFRYLKGAAIAEEYLKEWRGKRGGSTRLMRFKEEKSLKNAKSEFSTLSTREKKLFLAALYWAEGSKKDFGLSNTDPTLIRLFVNGLRETFHVSEGRLRVSVRIYEDLDREVCLAFWSEIVNIPKDRFVNVNVISGKKKGKLSHGMCRVRVARGGDLLKDIKAICKVIGEHMSP